MGWGGPWSSLLRRLVIPQNASNDDPRIVIGTDDPLSDGIDDAAISWYIADMKGFVTAVENSGGDPSFPFGQWRLYYASATEISQFISVDCLPTDPLYDQIRIRGGSRHPSCAEVGVLGNRVSLGSSFSSDSSLMDVQIFGRSLPRGLRARTAVNTGVVGSLTSVDSVVRTVPSTTYYAGRAYQVNVRGMVQISTAGNIRPRLLKTDLAGQVLADVGNVFVGTAAANQAFDWSTTFLISSSADVTAELAFACRTITGGVTGSFSGFSTSTFEIRVTDIGASADFSGYPVLT